MFGCLGRLGCLLLVAALAVGGYFTRAWWYPKVRAIVVAPPAAESVAWTPITKEAGETGARGAARLGEKSGPVYLNLTPAEFAAWQLEPAMKILGSAAANPEAAVHGDTMFVRANVAVTELGDPKQLGPLANMLDGRQPVVIGGRLAVTAPGTLGLQVTHLTVNDLRLPRALVERIVSRISMRARTDTLAPGVIAMPLPKGVAEARVTNGKVVLYKAVP
ncbi:MAG: hypothetical protein FJ363_13650 [Gemmatimonadetes bacterium]|nr:hypothetical protein [Gemmatimonadota bacterium]